MKMKFENVYQFKITLNDLEPAIWRRIQVPETYTFEDLHVAIQDAMGWDEFHLHEFIIKDPSTGYQVHIGKSDDSDLPVLEEKKQKLSAFFSNDNATAKYIYDFGDGWEHTVELEKSLPRDKDIHYPVCLDGERACPPEDCGGVPGYIEMLKVLNNKNDDRYESLMEWLSEEFDPEYFNKDEVIFSDLQ